MMPANLSVTSLGCGPNSKRKERLDTHVTNRLTEHYFLKYSYHNTFKLRVIPQHKIFLKLNLKSNKGRVKKILN